MDHENPVKEKTECFNIETFKWKLRFVSGQFNEQLPVASIISSRCLFYDMQFK